MNFPLYKKEMKGSWKLLVGEQAFHRAARQQTKERIGVSR